MALQDPPPAWASCSSDLFLGNKTFWNNSLEPNSDISGFGVVVSYIGTGWLSVIILCCHYFITFDPNTNPFPPHTDLESGMTYTSEAVDWVPNVVDQRIHRFGRICFRGALYAADRVLPRAVHLRWHIDLQSLRKAFEKCILTMCDIQILTGIGMLCSAFIMLPRMTIQSFDWAIIVQLSWFSNMTHQSGLVFMRRELHSKSRQWERRWRVFLMTVLAILLIVAMVPLAGFSWMDHALLMYDNKWHQYAWPARPANCLYDTSPDQGSSKDPSGYLNTNFMATLTSIILVVSSFLTRLVKLFNTSSIFVQLYLRATAARFCRRLVRKVSQMSTTNAPNGTLLLRNLFVAMYMLLRFTADFYTSTFSDILWILLMVTNATMKLVGILSIPDHSLSNWIHTISNFGQVLPLLLLAAPVLMMVQIISNETRVVDTITIPTDNQLFPEPVREHLEEDIHAQRHDGSFAADSPNDSQEDVFSFRRYSEAYWLNHMIALATCGAFLVSWATVLSFTVSAAFPELLISSDRRGSDYVVRTVINFILLGCDMMILGHIVILASTHFNAINKCFNVLIRVFIWSFFAYMSFLCRVAPVSLVFWDPYPPGLSAIPLWSLPVVYVAVWAGWYFTR